MRPSGILPAAASRRSSPVQHWARDCVGAEGLPRPQCLTGAMPAADPLSMLVDGLASLAAGEIRLTREVLEWWLATHRPTQWPKWLPSGQAVIGLITETCRSRIRTQRHLPKAEDEDCRSWPTGAQTASVAQASSQDTGGGGNAAPESSAPLTTWVMFGFHAAHARRCRRQKTLAIIQQRTT